MGRDYDGDLAAALLKQSELIKRQVILEIITMACECDNFDQFKKVLYALISLEKIINGKSLAVGALPGPST